VLIDSDGRVKVADFGLAKITNSAPNSGLTQTGMAMGTPDYVAPEALTLGVDVDGRADIYAVGVMLYQMLTGDIPRGMFKMPSQKFKAIDPRFDGIVRRALEHDREDRYQTSLELRRDLDVILTTPLAVAGQESSAVLPKQPAQTPGRTVVPSSRSPASMPQRRARPQYEAPPPEPPRSQSSTLPYVLAALGMLGIGGWFVMNPGALHQPEEIPQPPAGAVNPFDALITSPGPDGSDPGRVTPPSPTPTASVTPRPAASSPGPTSPSPSGGAASSVSAANRPQNTPKVPTPAPPPVVQPASIPKTVAEELALLESQFQSAFEREVNAQYADQIATLGINYLAALDREQAEASRAGRSNEATALREERSRYVTHKFMPSIDPASLHATIVRLRNTYREMEKVYSQKKDADSLPLYDLYIQVLNAMEKRLSGEGRVGDAGRVRVKRDDVIARRKQRAAKVSSRAALPPHARRNEAFLAADVFSNEAVLRELC
jgi:serine/threonine protein kinase